MNDTWFVCDSIHDVLTVLSSNILVLNSLNISIEARSLIYDCISVENYDSYKINKINFR